MCSNNAIIARTHRDDVFLINYFEEKLLNFLLVVRSRMLQLKLMFRYRSLNKKCERRVPTTVTGLVVLFAQA